MKAACSGRSLIGLQAGATCRPGHTYSLGALETSRYLCLGTVVTRKQKAVSQLNSPGS